MRNLKMLLETDAVTVTGSRESRDAASQRGEPPVHGTKPG